MILILTIIVYFCLGIVAGCYLLEYCYGSLDYKANNTQDKEKYHKLKIKITWIATLGILMLSIPLIVLIFIII